MRTSRLSTQAQALGASETLQLRSYQGVCLRGAMLTSKAPSGRNSRADPSFPSKCYGYLVSLPEPLWHIWCFLDDKMGQSLPQIAHSPRRNSQRPKRENTRDFLDLLPCKP